MTSFWSYWVSIITLGSIFGCAWLLYATRKSQTSDSETEDKMDHAFDGIEEYDNPLPKWWMHMFTATIIFALGYLIIYPGLGNFPGVIGWTSAGQWQEEIDKADELYTPIFEAYAEKPIIELAKDSEAMKVGQRLFANNCSVCHGSTGRGALGFPNLTDNDWLYGGEPETIKTTLLEGRHGQMPAKGLNPGMSSRDVSNLTHYLLSFSGRSDDNAAVEAGNKMFATACAACHGGDAKGMQAVGAPNLTDNIWLYGSTADKITQTINYGRAGVMPAQKGNLEEEKIHLLAAYVYSLSNK
jgi:cytochrome c oxidase cbb3-type subunit 3|tara:strand:+ start:3283 stop:4176 length:894 start_codon:yes stop_codon:yes gene_type:complete